ncbi:hypothetical protein PR048_005280 [Dryococelus australis]|uniref:HTH psq-type domain-containing protein n=1 Tax=Dryococelus australis TaxID=614101 RepID=A0ABQ9I7R9_9NEOP|nr:hypothetical protein PR048_005280 [Dryococelus australis]
MATIGKRPHYHSYTEEAMVDAVNAVQNSNMGVREASRRFDVPKTSLQDRLKGRVAFPTISGEWDQILTCQVKKNTNLHSD